MLLPVIQRDELHQSVVVILEVFFRFLQSTSPLLFFGLQVGNLMLDILVGKLSVKHLFF